ncbi:MAG TPA: M20/M25/M40 family metallo-hydrolase [Bacteroidota bacterium]|nr:M20/M25/M40 family metallo-hydrolase [Bacteroidota bacterium]
MKKKIFSSIFVVLLLFGCSSEPPKYSAVEVTARELRQHIQYLSSDELRGRRTGEEGNRLAAQYIADLFRSYGLAPIGDNGSYFQQFPFLKEVKEGPNNSFEVQSGAHHHAYTRAAQFLPLPMSGDTTLSAPLVFAGYGISLSADSLKYDDYASIDARGKIVVVLRYSPEGSESSHFGDRMSVVAKTLTARDHGAAGIIFVTAPPGKNGDALKTIYAPEAAFRIAACAFSWQSLDSLFRENGKDLATLQSQLDATRSPASFEFSATTATLRSDFHKEYSTSANIIGYLEGSDPTLKGDVFIIGAHMDHLGMGGQGSLAPDTVAIHHGADDNASGTAGLLEAAQYLSAERGRLKRSILFISFSGEELGLLGSDYYVKHPLLPTDHTIGMLNMDMIGRMKDSVLVVEGMGTSPEWEPIVRKENQDSLDIKLKPDGFGPSDHASFYAKDIPVMFFFTNLHSDYHRPSDTWDKINYTGEQKVVRYVVRVTEDVVNAESRPAFTKAVVSNPMATGSGDRPGVRVALGVIPDFAETESGVKISGTRPGSAAEKAGLKGNDTIIKFGGKDVTNIYDFMYLLGQYKPGDQVDIVVKRGTENVNLKATLEERK